MNGCGLQPRGICLNHIPEALKETLIKFFNKPVLRTVEGLRTNGRLLISLVVSLSNALLSKVEGHEWNLLVQSLLKHHLAGY